RRHEEEDRLNRDLLTQAQTLARLVYFYSDYTKATTYRGLSELGLLTAVAGPNPWAALPTWGMQTMPGPTPYSFLVWRKYVAEIKFKEHDLLEAGQVAEYFQIDSTWGSSYRSASLKESKLKFPAVNKQLASNEAISWEFDRATLGADHSVRRVVLKVPATRLLPWGPPGGSAFMPPGPGGFRAGRNPPRPPREAGIPGPRHVLVIQCACGDQLTDTLAAFAAQRDQELASLQAQTELALGHLRQQL